MNKIRMLIITKFFDFFLLPPPYEQMVSFINYAAAAYCNVEERWCLTMFP